MFSAESMELTVAEAMTMPLAEEIQSDLDQLKPNIIRETLNGWAPELLLVCYRLLTAAIIVLVGMQIARLVRKFLHNGLERVEIDTGLRRFLVSLANVAMYMLIFLMAAERIGIPSTSILAVLGSAGLAIGLALQGSLSNFAGSIVILVLRPFTIGDYITFSTGEGTVVDIGLVYTTLATTDNRFVSVPNGQLSNTTVTNVTHQKIRRLEVSVKIGYQSDLKLAKLVLTGILKSHPLVLQDEPISVFVSELGESAVILGARAWTETGNHWATKCDVLEEIKIQLEESGIEIPFQQMDINIHK